MKTTTLAQMQWELKEQRELVPKIAAFQKKIADLYDKTTLVDARMVGRRYEVIKKDDKGELIWTTILKADLAKLLLEKISEALYGDQFIWITPEAWKMFIKLHECWSARDELERTLPEYPHHDVMSRYYAQNWGDKKDRLNLLVTIERDLEVRNFGRNENVA